MLDPIRKGDWFQELALVCNVLHNRNQANRVPERHPYILTWHQTKRASSKRAAEPAAKRERPVPRAKRIERGGLEF